MTDKKEKNNSVDPLACEQDRAAIACVQEAARQPEKKLARGLVSAFNWLGVNTIMNSSLSLWITFKALPTDTAQSAMRGMGKWVFRPMIIATDKVKGLFGKSALAGLSKEKANFKINEYSRSTAEVVCMVIAGSLLLPVVKYVENHREQWVNTIDGWLHPSHKKQNQEQQKEATEPGKEPFSWGKLLKARAIGLAGVFGVNHLMQTYNNNHPKGALNSDVAFTKAGNWLFDKLPEKTRHRFVWVFSGFSDQRINVGSIQPAMQKRAFAEVDKELKVTVRKLGQIQRHIRTDSTLANASGATYQETHKRLEAHYAPKIKKWNDKIAAHPEWKGKIEKAIFGEQTRLFGKEVSLTLLITGIMYAITKTKGSLLDGVLETCGIKAKSPAEPAPASKPDAGSTETGYANKKWSADHATKRNAGPATAPSSFQESVTQSVQPQALGSAL